METGDFHTRSCYQIISFHGKQKLLLIEKSFVRTRRPFWAKIAFLTLDFFVFLWYTARVFHPQGVSWCNGSTRDFDSLCLGSNPGETTGKYDFLRLVEVVSD